MQSIEKKQSDTIAREKSSAETYLLFSDGSVNTKNREGYGAYLYIKESEIKAVTAENIKERIGIKHFEKVSSTRLEIKTLIWAIENIVKPSTLLKVYTDSQTIIDLPRRRAKLEETRFIAKNHKPLNNADLYQEFYKLYDTIPFQLHKLKGHKAKHEKTAIDHVFSWVDKAARKALRNTS